MSATMQLLEVRGTVSPEPRVHYIHHVVEVPAGATRVTARLRYRKERLCQLFLSIFDPQGFRGCHMQPGAQGEVDLTLAVGLHDASRGGIPGVLPAGRWTVQVDVERTIDTTEYLLTVEVEQGQSDALLEQPYPDDYICRAAAGWYRGELHAHSWESDGKVPVREVVAAAKQLGLDYLALTDHFTTSGYRYLADLQSPELALIRSMEHTGHFGHANLHGLRRWHDVFTDGRDDWDINQLARSVRDAGGLFCVNHVFGADLGWRYHEFDWDLADLLEIWHAHEGPGNTLSVGLWDEHLRQGRRIVGVAATDSHDPYAPRHRLGTVVTAIHAAELSEAALLEGLRSGRAFGSRGPHLELTATSVAQPDELIVMGGELPAGLATFRVELGLLRYPWRLHVLKNGFHHAIFEQLDTAPEHVIEFHDTAAPGDYYRVELHTIPAYSDFSYQRWRDWHTMLAFSNPIYVAQGK